MSELVESTSDRGFDPARAPIEPIAVIGMSCRLPGGIRSPEEFWNLLKSAKSGITEVPSERWNSEAYYSKHRATAGKVISRKGGFLDGVDLFDPAFFGISETEAPYVDPQQRLLLEVTWEAFERAGLVMDAHRGAPVGVFIGCFTADYLHIQFANPYEVGAYTATGAIGTMVAARISHTFDFRGPSLAIDTACSSSLHSVHLACESLRCGDSDVAVAGGTQLALIPEFNIAETKAGFLSDSGECRTFDAGARGYVRSEGVGVVVLKRLRDALAAGDPIQCVILGSAINQDGRTPSIAQPNRSAQEEVMRKACARAGIAPASVAYVEAHGTGTSAGDRTEAEAIGNVFRVEPGCASELLVGSCKSNIGHAEAAAGIAGLIKAALCVKHQEVPPNLHFETANPAIGFDHLRIRVPVAITPLAGEPVVACVTGFGFGGSNAAVVIRSALEVERVRLPEQSDRARVLPISARSAAALEESARNIARWLETSPNADRLADLCHTAATRRVHHEYRRAFVFRDRASLQKQLSSFESGESRALDSKGTAWVFSGAGNQRFHTGLALYREEPVFRTALDQCDEIYRGLAGFSLLEAMRSGPADEYIKEGWLAHPVTVAIQIGLVSLFRSWGLRPAAVVGHSLGESTACYAAGVYSLEQTLELVFHRCECLKPLHATGGLLAVAASEESVRSALGNFAGEIAIAARNGPATITLSGDNGLLTAAHQQLNAAGIRSHLLPELIGCHYRYSALEVATSELETRIQGLKASDPEIPLYSTVTGDRLQGSPEPAHWATHLLQPVNFRGAISTLVRHGFLRFLELGPNTILSGAISATAGEATSGKARVRVFGSLHHDRDERTSLLASLGGLYECGERVNWHALYPSGEVLDLPTYPWQRSRYWREPEQSVRHRKRPSSFPLLGERDGDGGTSWRAEISAEKFPFLLDHRIRGEAIFPAAGYIDMALSAGHEHFAGSPFAIEDLRFLKALPLAPSSAFFTDFQIDATSGSFTISATRSFTDRSMQRVAEGTLRCVPPGINVAQEPPFCPDGENAATSFSGDQLYDFFKQRRYDYSGAFRGIKQAWVDGDSAYCEIELPAAHASGHSFHPAILDAAFQSLLCISVAREPRDSRVLEIPDSIGSIRVIGTPTRRMTVWARVRDTGSGSTGELRIFDDSRKLIAHVADFSTVRSTRALASKVASSLDQDIYRTEWVRAEGGASPVEPSSHQAWIIVADSSPAAQHLQARVNDSGVARVIVAPSSSNGTICASVLDAARMLSHQTAPSKLWVLTLGAHQIADSDTPPDPFQSAVWGLARAIGQREMPRIWGGLIDLPSHAAESEIDAALHAIAHPDHEDQLAFRGDKRFVLRLGRLPVRASHSPKVRLRKEGAYVVTGAFGALGREVARWMVARGARRLILPTRRAPETCNPMVAELESMGARVEVISLDLSGGRQVGDYFAGRQKDIRGVVYCAGHSNDQLAANLDPATLDQVFDTKAAGAWALHHALRDAPLEHFVLFSSIASVLPNPGMGAYSAANCFLDALATHRRALGLPGLSIGWGPWEIGMTERPGVKEYLTRAGLRCFDARTGIQMLEHLWHSEHPTPIAVAADWKQAFGGPVAALPIYDQLRAEAEGALNSKSGNHSSNGTAPHLSRAEHLHNLIGSLISTKDRIHAEIPLVDQGLDSLGATVLVESLYRDYGVNVDPDAFAEGLTLQDLADRLAS